MQFFEQRDRRRCVDRLMTSAQRERDPIEPVVRCVEADDRAATAHLDGCRDAIDRPDHPRIALAAGLGNHSVGVSGQRPADDRDSRLDDPRLLARDRRQRSAKLRLMVESIDVIAAASGVTTLVASSRPPSPTSSTAMSTPCSTEQLEGDCGRALEERRGRFECARRHQLLDRAPAPPSPPTASSSVVDLLPVDHESLFEPFEVRRRVSRGAMAGRAQRRARPSP